MEQESDSVLGFAGRKPGPLHLQAYGLLVEQLGPVIWRRPVTFHVHRQAERGEGEAEFHRTEFALDTKANVQCLEPDVRDKPARTQAV
jgi:hypothetical protein